MNLIGYAIEALAIVAIYTYKPAIGVVMNEKFVKFIAWARKQIGTRKDVS